MIHFVQALQNETLQIIREAHDCADILHDLECIERTKANIYFCRGISAADQLDQELRRNPLLSPLSRVGQAASIEEAAINSLQQDYCGILCDTALKKQLAHELKDCIESVD